MSELPWFKFSPDAWLAGGISHCSDITQGVFIQICCQYWKAGCSLDEARLKQRSRVDEDLLKRCLKELYELGVFKIVYGESGEAGEAGGRVVISFLDEQYQELTERREKLVAAGRKGGSQAKARLKPGLSQVKARPKHKEGEGDVEGEGEGEAEGDATAATPPEYLQFFKIQACYIPASEEWWFQKAWNTFTRDFLKMCISECREERINKGLKPRVCMSDLQVRVTLNQDKYKDDRIGVYL